VTASDTFVVRQARPAELAEAGEVTVAAYRAAGLTVGDYANVLRDAAKRSAEAELIVAVDAFGKVFGTVTFCPADSPWRELAGPDEGEVRMLGVHPGAQRLGVGRALTEACIARARVLGFHELVLSTPSRATAAHRLYEGLGFERAPHRDWSPVAGIELLAYTKALI
jgi:ribosomal protein S18 acetylase RimI-like enzyme